MEKLLKYLYEGHNGGDLISKDECKSHIKLNLLMTNLMVISLLSTVIVLAPNSRALSVWKSPEDTDFNDVGYNLTNCAINNNIIDAYITLKIAGDWIQINTSSGPKGRAGSQLSPIGNNDSILMFGGDDGETYINDTWVFNPSNDSWSQRHPVDYPSSRQQFSMTSICVDDKVVLFGGYYYDNRILLNDTWVYYLSEDKWRNMRPTIGPSPRHSPAMAGLDNTDKILLFGGYDSLDDTWIYDSSDNNWTQLFPVNKPPGRHSTMVTVWNDDKVILFGGVGNGCIYCDTWIYDLSDNQWYQQNPKEIPEPQVHPALASIFNDDRIVMYASGGFSSISAGNTWMYDISEDQWFLICPKKYNKPPIESGATIAPIRNTNKVLLFGGWGKASISRDTWLYDFSAYNTTGEYISPFFDTGGPSSFNSMLWRASLPEGTSILFQLRTARTLSGLQSQAFVGHDGTSDSFYSSGSALWPGHEGDKWGQFKVYLGTKNQSVSPILEEVTISYNRFPEAPILTQPMNSTWVSISQIKFEWLFNDSDSTEQNAFELQMTTRPDSNETIWSSGQIEINETAYSLKADIGDGFWYWRVRTRDLDGDWGPFSAYLLIKIDRTPPLPFVPSADPSNWTKFDPVVHYFTTDALSGIDHYEAQIDRGPYIERTSPFNVPSQPDGQYNLSIRAFDLAGNYRTEQIMIYIDHSPPVNVSIRINDGKAMTGNIDVLLYITGKDPFSGPAQMCFSDDGLAYSPWEPFMGIKKYRLSNGAGDKTIFIKIKDHAGNEASPVNSSIRYKPESNDILINWNIYTALIIIIATSLIIWLYLRKNK